jgi:hypothetical protein
MPIEPTTIMFDEYGGKLELDIRLRARAAMSN